MDDVTEQSDTKKPHSALGVMLVVMMLSLIFGSIAHMKSANIWYVILTIEAIVLMVDLGRKGDGSILEDLFSEPLSGIVRVLRSLLLITMITWVGYALIGLFS